MPAARSTWAPIVCMFTWLGCQLVAKILPVLPSMNPVARQNVSRAIRFSPTKVKVAVPTWLAARPGLAAQVIKHPHNASRRFTTNNIALAARNSASIHRQWPLQCCTARALKLLPLQKRRQQAKGTYLIAMLPFCELTQIETC